MNANRDKMESSGVDVNEMNQASQGQDLPERAPAPIRVRPRRKKRM